MAIKKTQAADEIAATGEAASPSGEADPVCQSGTHPATEKPDVVDAGFCVYIGPSITGVIQTGTIYHGCRADALKSAELAVKRYPLVTDLIVTGDTLAVDRIKVKTPGNLLYVNYHRLASRKK